MTVLGGEAVLAWRGWKTGIALRKCFSGILIKGISCVRMGGSGGSLSSTLLPPETENVFTQMRPSML